MAVWITIISEGEWEEWEEDSRWTICLAEEEDLVEEASEEDRLAEEWEEVEEEEGEDTAVMDSRRIFWRNSGFMFLRFTLCEAVLSNFTSLYSHTTHLTVSRDPVAPLGRVIKNSIIIMTVLTIIMSNSASSHLVPT